MKRFDEFRVGDEFQSTCSISEAELESYLNFARIKNAFLNDGSKNSRKIVSGRAAMARMEGEFTRLSQIHGNEIILIGSDGDSEWGNRSTRFIKTLYTDDVLDIRFTISGKEDIDDNYGRLVVDYKGADQDGNAVIVSRKNIYRVKKVSRT